MVKNPIKYDIKDGPWGGYIEFFHEEKGIFRKSRIIRSVIFQIEKRDESRSLISRYLHHVRQPKGYRRNVEHSIIETTGNVTKPIYAEGTTLRAVLGIIDDRICAVKGVKLGLEGYFEKAAERLREASEGKEENEGPVFTTVS